MTPRVIAESPEDGGQALDFLPDAHEGACALKLEGRSGIKWVLFPNAAEGREAAGMANQYDIGGFMGVELHQPAAAPAGAPQFASAIDWLME